MALQCGPHGSGSSLTMFRPHEGGVHNHLPFRFTIGYPVWMGITSHYSALSAAPVRQSGLCTLPGRESLTSLVLPAQQLSSGSQPCTLPGWASPPCGMGIGLPIPMGPYVEDKDPSDDTSGFRSGGGEGALPESRPSGLPGLIDNTGQTDRPCTLAGWEFPKSLTLPSSAAPVWQSAPAPCLDRKCPSHYSRIEECLDDGLNPYSLDGGSLLTTTLLINSAFSAAPVRQTAPVPGLDGKLRILIRPSQPSFPDRRSMYLVGMGFTNQLFRLLGCACQAVSPCALPEWKPPDSFNSAFSTTPIRQSVPVPCLDGVHQVVNSAFPATPVRQSVPVPGLDGNLSIPYCTGLSDLQGLVDNWDSHNVFLPGWQGPPSS